MAHFCKKLQADCRRGWMLALTAMLIVFAPAAFAQSAPTVTGTVTDQSGQPVIGATIIEQGTTNGATTGVDGSYSLKLRGGGNSANLIFQSLGFVSQTVAVNGRTKIDVKLAEDAVALDAVVAIGYGTVKQKDLTTAVSVVKTDDLARRPITSASGALQGKAAGVQVIQPNGSPGQGMVVRVRGASSISSSNDPLYVVDGVPVGEGNYAIAYLSPNEIESMQVLKDASSAAIYGSRAANGVVLITTKQGSRKRGPEISFSTFVGISKVTKSYDVLNARQYRDLMEENGAVSGLPADLTDRTDWFDETYSTGVNQNYQFSVSNGDENSSYYLGGGYTNEKGIINTTSSDRYNVKASFDKKIFKWVSANASTTFSHYTTKGTIISGQGANRAGVVVSAITTPTYAPIWDPENPQQFYNNFYGANLTSPRENMARTDYNQDVTDRLLLSGGLTFYLAKDLTFKSTVSMDRRWVHSSSFLDPIRTSYGRTQHGTASDTRSDDMRMIYDNILTWNKSFDRHSLEVMAGTSATTSVWEQLSGSRSYFSSTNNNAIPNLNGGNNGGVRGQSYGKSEWSIMSYLARVSYNYDSKYLVTANFRADGSSKLAPGHRWGYFPAASAGWVVSKEGFWPQNSVVSMLKARVSYGLTGNNGIGLYDTYGSYNSLYTYNGNATTTTNTMPNNGLIWEKTLQFNAGIDLGLLDNRITLALDYYNKETRDLLFDVSLPNTTGYNSVSTNLGRVRFYGTELSLSSVNIDRKGFSWRTDFTYSYNMNRVLELPDNGNPRNRINGISVGDGSQFGGIAEGERMGRIFGYVAERIIETQEEADAARYDTQSRGYRRSDRRQIAGRKDIGDYEWKDRPGSTRMDGRQIINAEDQFLLGYALPHSTGGIGNTFRYRNWTLNVYMDYALGHSVRNDMQMRYFQSTMGNCNYNLTNEVKKCWSQPGDDTRYARFTANDTDWGNRNYGRTSDIFVEKADYLCIRDVTLAYDLPVRWIKKLGMKKLTVSVTGNTLYYFTKVSGSISPESGAGADGNLYKSTSTGDATGNIAPNARKVLFSLKCVF